MLCSSASGDDSSSMARIRSNASDCTAVIKRIDRSKVDNIIAELLKRVAQINASPELCYFVNEIRLFGSAINGEAESFGDVDIAYDLGRRKRPPGYKDWHDWSRKRWKLAGRSNLDFMQEL